MMTKLLNKFQFIFQQFHLSMRRRITVGYAFLYSCVSLMIIVFVPFLYLFISTPSGIERQHNWMNDMLYAYDAQEITLERMEAEFEVMTQRGDVAFRIQDGEEILLETGVFKEQTKSYGIFQRIKAVFGEGKMYKRLSNQFIRQGEDGYSYSVYVLYPLYFYYGELFGLIFIVMFFQILGGVLICVIGEVHVKKILNPIYHMTKVAEEVSMSNITLRIDVEATKYELKDLAMTLNEMLDRLDRDYSKQKSFVSDVSHELRTPISIINGYASMLERWGKKDAEILDESVDAIVSEGKNMQHLVENLLTLVRSDNHTLQFNYLRFNLSDLLNDTVREFKMLNSKEQHILCQVPDMLYVTLDESKMRQALRIFVDNAVKYTPEQGVINIKAARMGNELHLHIKDNGMGIDKDALPYLFDRFYRSDVSRARQTGGYGLGLSIAKAIVLGHKGKIHVKSALGKGSEFICVFPMDNQIDLE